MAGLDDMSMDQLLALRQQTVANAAIKQNESAGAPDTANPVNPASGARSSMQVMPKTAGDPGFGVKPSNGTPADDARMGRDYRAALQQKYGDPETAAIAYDWGPGNADKWIANGRKLDDLPLETLKYLKNYKTQVAAAGQPPAPAGMPGNGPGPMAFDQPPPAIPPGWQPPGALTMGMGDTIGGALRAIIHGGSKVASYLAPDSDFAKSIAQAEQQIDATRAAEQQKFAASNPDNGGLTRTIGAALPALAIPAGAPETVLGAAAMGGAQGALMGAAGTQPGEDYGQTMMAGAGAGIAGGAAAGALGRAIGGANVNPNVRALMDMGVTVPPQRIIGGTAARMGEKIGNTVPLAGDAIQSADRASIQQVNRAMYQAVLDPIGGQAPAEVGRNGVDQTLQRVTDAYNQLLPNLTFRTDPQLVNDLATISQRVNNIPNQALRDDFMHHLDQNLIGQLDAQGNMTGLQFKAAESNLTERARTMSAENNSFSKDLGGIYRDTRTAMQQALARANPQDAPRLQAINQAWANGKILQNAAARVNDPEMPIMPGQMQAAVKQMALRNNNQRAFATGAARMQDISDPAMAVLAQKYPNSGTAGNYLASHAVGGILAGGATAAAPGLAIPAGVATIGLFGTPLGRQAMQAAIAQRPEIMRTAGRGLLSAAPRIGAAAALENRNAAAQ